MSTTHPELAPLIAALQQPRPFHTHYRSVSGAVLPLVDRAWLDSNEAMHASNVRELLDRPDFAQGNAMTIPVAIRAYGLMEIARLRDRRFQMESRGIDALLTEDDVLAMRAGGASLVAA